MLRIRFNRESHATQGLPFPMGGAAAEKQLPTLLIVDDDEQVRRVSARLLGAMYRVETASDPLEAAYMLRCRRYDAILTDFDMPGRNGLWVLNAARTLNPDARRVLFSGSGPSDLSAHLDSKLVHSFVPKPAGRGELISALRPGFVCRVN